MPARGIRGPRTRGPASARVQRRHNVADTAVPILALAARACNRRYLKPGFGCPCCSRRAGVLCAFCRVEDTLPEQCLRRRPRASLLVAAVLELIGYYVNAVQLHVHPLTSWSGTAYTERASDNRRSARRPRSASTPSAARRKGYMRVPPRPGLAGKLSADSCDPTITAVPKRVASSRTAGSSGASSSLRPAI
jgi:hypothetical protein